MHGHGGGRLDGPPGVEVTSRWSDDAPDRPRALLSPGVAAGSGADLFVLVAPRSSAGRGDPAGSPDPAGPAVYLVGASEARIRPLPTLDPNRAMAEVIWDSRRATKLSDPVRAADLIAALVDRAALIASATLIGLADAMIAMSAAYAQNRQQFGRPIGSFQAVKHHLANARVKLEFARPAVYRAAFSLAQRSADRSGADRSGDQHGRIDHDLGASPVSRHTSMAKALASDAAEAAAGVALQVHGAIGYTAECDLHLWMKPAWALARAWGDARTHRARVLDSVLDELAATTPSTPDS